LAWAKNKFPTGKNGGAGQKLSPLFNPSYAIEKEKKFRKHELRDIWENIARASSQPENRENC